MKKLLSLISVIVILNGCNENSDEPGGVFIESIMYAKVFDANGSDLLDPKTSNGLTNIQMFKFINNKEVLIYNPDLAAPNGYIISKPKTVGEHVSPYKFYSELYKDWNMCIHLSMSELNETSGKWFYDQSLKAECRIATSRTLIKWTDTDMDMVKAEYVCFKTGSVNIAKIWVNDELKWDSNRDLEEDIMFIFTKTLE